MAAPVLTTAPLVAVGDLVGVAGLLTVIGLVVAALVLTRRYGLVPTDPPGSAHEAPDPHHPGASHP